MKRKSYFYIASVALKSARISHEANLTMKLFIFSLMVVIASCKTTKAPDADCKGEAVKDCICTEQYDPVCGCDNKTYGNACNATCAGVKRFTKGACPTK